jgi:aminopeptidase N
MAFAEPGVQPHYGPSWTFRIVDAAVRLHIDPEARTYTGRSAFDVETLPTFRGVYVFDLEGVEVTSVEDGTGAPLPFSAEDSRVKVHAPADVGRIVFAYGGGEQPAGLYFTGPTDHAPDRDRMAWTQCQDEDAHFFMPCLDHPRIKHPWTIHVTAPAACTVISNGERVRHEVDGDRVVAEFRQADPMPVYLFSVVVGPLERTESRWNGRPVDYFVPRGRSGDVERAFGRTPEMLQVFSDVTGVVYPWPRYDQVVVHDFIFGGMENVAATTMTELLLVDERVGPHWDPDGLVCHELAHQWFGDLVTCQDWSQAWLNESFATFMETVWWDHAKPADEATWYAFQQQRAYQVEDGGRYRRPIASYLFREPIDMFDRHLYEKGAVVLRTLRTELGEAAFWAGVKTYLERHAHGTVHGRQFQIAMEDATGANLDRFVHQWILGAGHPTLTVHMEHDDGLLTVSVKQTQSGEQVADVFHFPLRLELVTADGRVTQTLPVRERERTWVLPVSSEIRTVRVDPGFNVLSHLSIEAPVAWLCELAADPCPVLAARALAALAKMNRPASIAGVGDALRTHPFWGVRAEAAKLLGGRGGKDSLAMLVEAHASETEPRARVALANALGQFRDAAAATALLAGLERDGATWHELGATLMALGRTRDPRAVEALRGFLDKDSWGDLLRQRAAVGLAHTQHADVLGDLLAASHGGPRAQSGAATALGVLGDAVESVRRACRERLSELVEDGGFRAKLSALSALGVLGDPAALPLLERTHRSAPDGRVRRYAYEASVKVRRGRTSEEGLATLRARVERLAEENGRLRGRIDRLDRA